MTDFLNEFLTYTSDVSMPMIYYIPVHRTHGASEYNDDFQDAREKEKQNAEQNRTKMTTNFFFGNSLSHYDDSQSQADARSHTHTANHNYKVVKWHSVFYTKMFFNAHADNFDVTF